MKCTLVTLLISSSVSTVESFSLAGTPKHSEDIYRHTLIMRVVSRIMIAMAPTTKSTQSFKSMNEGNKTRLHAHVHIHLGLHRIWQLCFTDAFIRRGLHGHMDHLHETRPLIQLLLHDEPLIQSGVSSSTHQTTQRHTRRQERQST